MTTFRWLAVGLSAAAMLVVGCVREGPVVPPGPGSVARTIRVYVDENGKIDKARHETVIVFAGEAVEFACSAAGGAEDAPCPAGVEFLVADLEHVGELARVLGHLPEVDHLPEAGRQAAAALDSAGGKPLSRSTAEATFGPLMAELDDAALERLMADSDDLRVPELDGLLGCAWQNRRAGASERIRSEAYPRGRGSHLFKFTWVVFKGDHRDVWDPHIAAFHY